MTDDVNAAAGPQPLSPGQKARLAYGWFAIWIVVAGLLALVAVKLYQVTLGPVSAGAAPEFALDTFSGETYRLAQLRGNVVVVNFWASWCEPCKEEAADLQRFWVDYRERGVVLLGVGYVDTETEARSYLTQFGVTYPNGPDLGTRISQAYRIKGVPETYIIAPDGRLVTNIIGPTTYEALRQIVEPLLQ